jgi:integrase
VLRQLQRDPLARFSAENLSPSAVAAYVERRQRSGASGSTINRSLAAMASATNWAHKRGIRFAPDLFKGQRQPENAARARRVEGDELQRILAQCDPHMAAFVDFLVESAMRRGEAAGCLLWENIDLRRRVAVLPTTKNGSPRRVPLSSAAVAILERMPRPLVGGRVFPHHPDVYSHRFAAACKAAGVEGLRLHDIRAEAISRRAEQGLDLPALKAISGHKSNIVLRYLRVGDVEALAQRLG